MQFLFGSKIGHQYFCTLIEQPLGDAYTSTKSPKTHDYYSFVLTQLSVPLFFGIPHTSALS
jgi:hypothetical protein